MPYQLALLASLGVIAIATGPATADPVAVDLLEGTFKDKSWDLSTAKVSERYTEPAFGFVAVPGKYSNRGLLLDRSNPYMVRANQKISLPAGEYTLLVRARGASRLYVDDKLLLETNFLIRSPDGHGKVAPLPKVDAGLHYPFPGQQERRATLAFDGKSHVVRFEFFVGLKDLRPEVGEPAVAVALKGKPFQIFGSDVIFDDESWDRYAKLSAALHQKRDTEARRTASAEEARYWDGRHALARTILKDLPAVAIPEVGPKTPVHNAIDRFVGKKLEAKKIEPTPLTDDDAFVRRVYLDTVGVIPTPEEIAAFQKDTSVNRRARLIDKLLADPRWADHWVGYWQDVLAENPGLLKPTLNNTGPFRWWIYQSLLDNLPMDRFASELISMEGSFLHGAPGGFAVATENDVPMAAKAQVLGKAFLGLDMTCSRCHDSPSSRGFKQEQLFGLAAMLAKAPITLPKTSSVPVGEGGRIPNVPITLHVGSKVTPTFLFGSVLPDTIPEGVLQNKEDARERVAALITSPRNERFAQVLANRVWKRYLGVGLVENPDDWSRAKPAHPELLAWLGREMIGHNYDLKHTARLILNSHAYQRTVCLNDDIDANLFAGPARRRMSAEQIVDSLFVAAGKEFDCEMLTFDIEGRQLIKQCLNFGYPRRAWNFVAMANERDRPALALPKAQMFVDILQAYGWRDSRTAAQTEREEEPTVLQPMIMANGLSHIRAGRLSDDSAFTAMSLKEQTLPELIEQASVRILSRKPTDEERSLFEELLSDGFPERKTGQPPAPKNLYPMRVSWGNHLSPQATTLKLEMEKRALAGDPPTPQLKDDWRKRMEDVVWALINSPEFVFVP
jgi:Protein of unknown function (DUF1553)/Protein of unknown function (DUF1549)